TNQLSFQARRILMSKKFTWLTALLVVVTLLVAACGGGAPAAAPAAEATEAPAEAAPATEAVTETTTVTDTAAVTATETTTETSAAAEPVATGDCTVATDGELAGVDPSGQTVVWWHNHSGSREEGLKGLIEEFNSGNPCGITVDAQNQGS